MRNGEVAKTRDCSAEPFNSSINKGSPKLEHCARPTIPHARLAEVGIK